MVLRKVVILIILILMFGCGVEQEPVEPPAMPEAEPVEEITQEQEEVLAQPGSEIIPAIKTFHLTGENFKFMMDGKEAPELKVNVGDRVRINFTNIGGFHDWVIDEFNARTEKIRAPESRVVEFIANKSGIFEYYCSVGSHRAQGMKGNLIVT